MKTWCIVIFALFTGPLFSQENNKEEQDAFALAAKAEADLKRNGTPRLTILTEFIELEQSDLNKWLADSENKTDGADFRKHVLTLQNDGAAALVDMSIISTTSEHRAYIESADWHIFPRGVEPPKYGKNSGNMILPAGYHDCETRKTGAVTWVEAIIGKADEYSPLLESRASVAPRKIGINISPEYIERVGEAVFGKDESEARSQLFQVLKTNGQLTIEAGVSSLVGLVNREIGDKKKPVLVFVRADVHQAKRKSKGKPTR